jgi:hypothetical protein
MTSPVSPTPLPSDRPSPRSCSSALILMLDCHRLPNARLVAEEAPGCHQLYDRKSVAEKNSIAAWFMRPDQ